MLQFKNVDSGARSVYLYHGSSARQLCILEWITDLPVLSFFIYHRSIMVKMRVLVCLKDEILINMCKVFRTVS